MRLLTIPGILYEKWLHLSWQFYMTNDFIFLDNTFSITWQVTIYFLTIPGILAQAFGVAVGRRLGGPLATILVFTIYMIIFFPPPISPSLFVVLCCLLFSWKECSNLKNVFSKRWLEGPKLGRRPFSKTPLRAILDFWGSYRWNNLIKNVFGKSWFEGPFWGPMVAIWGVPGRAGMHCPRRKKAGIIWQLTFYFLFFYVPWHYLVSVCLKIPGILYDKWLSENTWNKTFSSVSNSSFLFVLFCLICFWLNVLIKCLND